MPNHLEVSFNDFALSALLYKADPGSKKPLLFCLPGGGAGRGFFDLAPNFSFTSLMNGLGFDVLIMDHPGTATNPLPDYHGFLTPRQSADYITWALKTWVHDRDVIGLGHSMGGFIVTLMQARHNCFTALALLGSSAGGLDWGLTEEELLYKNDPDAVARDQEKLTLAKFKTAFPKGVGGGPSGKSITFGGETPLLTQALRENTCELFAAGGMMSMIAGSFSEEVKAIDIPMFFAFGDHDIGIPPRDVPKDYVNAPSTKLIILENTGHNHMAFSSIYHLATQLGDWAKL